MEEYLTAKQVAEYLQVKPLTIYQWARDEKIPAIKIGRIWRFKKEAIDAVLPDLRSTGLEFDVELLWHLSRKGYTLIEVPVIWNDTQDSRLRLSDTLSMLVTLFRVRIRS